MLLQAISMLTLAVTPPQGGSAKELIERMMARYHAAQTLTGTVKLTVKADTGSATLDTAIQYERPAKLYIRQQKNVSNPDPEQPSQWLVTSDGKLFSYNVPNDRFASAPGLRLVEPVDNPRVRVKHDLASIYSASSKSIGDRSMPLDIAIAGRTDLVYRRAQWVNYAATGSREFNGKQATIITGDFRQYAGAPTSGKYQMAITAEGDLVQYIEQMTVAVEQGDNPRTMRITSQWDVSLVPNGKVDPSLFKVITR